MLYITNVCKVSLLLLHLLACQTWKLTYFFAACCFTLPNNISLTFSTFSASTSFSDDEEDRGPPLRSSDEPSMLNSISRLLSGFKFKFALAFSSSDVLGSDVGGTSTLTHTLTG